MWKRRQVKSFVAEGVDREGNEERMYPTPPQPTKGLESIVSSPVHGADPAEKGFFLQFESPKNTSADNRFGNHRFE